MEEVEAIEEAEEAEEAEKAEVLAGKVSGLQWQVKMGCSLRVY